MVTRAPYEASGGFEPALEMLERRAETRLLATGVQGIDHLIGGLEPGLMYLFYGTERGGLPDRLLHHLLIEAVRDGEGRAIHVLCGNYRRSRTTLNMELLLRLAERARLNLREAFGRIHIVCAFSERQRAEAADHVGEILEAEECVRLVAVQQVAKLLPGPPLIGKVIPEDPGDMASRLKRLCGEAGIPLIATCGVSPYGRPVPAPDGGSHLSHLPKVTCYLRILKGGGATAYLLNHPDRARVGKRIDIDEEDLGLGRTTKKMNRQRLQERMLCLRDRYRRALGDDSTRASFDSLWAAWSVEQDAMSYGDALSALDLLALTASVDSRHEIEAPKAAGEETRGLLQRLTEGGRLEG
jgi:RecA/RadA recombinase